MIAQIFVFMWIPQLIGCGIHMIMVRAAVRRARALARVPGSVAGQRCRRDKPDETGARARREGGERLE
jgi:hypothetical protein